MRVDLHNHTHLCNHATGTPEEYIKKAIDLKINVYGFSEHAPMKNFEDGYRLQIEQKKIYEQTIRKLKEQYKDKIEILLGYEVDYIKGDYILESVLKSDIDYLIGSVHYLKDWGFDNPAYLKEYKKRNIDDIYQEYFEAVNNMIKENKFDIIGHFDLIKIFNFKPKKEIKSLVYPTLKLLKKMNMVLEINSAGFRKPVQEQYPSKDILELAYELNIPITFSSDAHSVDQVGKNYYDCVTIAQNIGYQNCVIFQKRNATIVPI